MVLYAIIKPTYLTLLDVIGVCKRRGDMVTFTSKAGKELKKREIVLVDKTNREVRILMPANYSSFVLWLNTGANSN